MTNRTYITAFTLLLVAAASGCFPGEPDELEQTPLYRWQQEGGEPSSGERGNMMVTEINFAGSVTDDGVRDADDIFIELQNKHPRPINPTGWHIIVEGDVDETYRIPPVDEPIPQNGFFVIARKKDGAFKDVADVFIEDLDLGSKHVFIELRDFDRRLMESAGSHDKEVFAGGWDTVSVRSMERVQLIFGNRGGQSRNWHAFSQNRGLDSIADGWRRYTLASPGLGNSPDYSGSSSSGNFE